MPECGDDGSISPAPINLPTFEEVVYPVQSWLKFVVHNEEMLHPR